MAGLSRGVRRALSATTNTTKFDTDLDLFGKKKQNRITLRNLLEAGSGKILPKPSALSARDAINIQVACFLHREMPIRLAHRALALESSQVFRNSKHVMQVASWYKDSFRQLVDAAAPVDLPREAAFHRLIQGIFDRHSATLITMAKGALEIKNSSNYDTHTFSEYDEVQLRLDDFYLSRIGKRILIGQYLALREAGANADTIGLVSLKCSVHEIAREAIADASFVCRRVHGVAPDVIIMGPDLHFAHIPAHLRYILLELLKNSMRATIETHGVDKPPPIKIIISDGRSNEDVVVKVSDEGGGIKRSNMKRIWSYLFTTADQSTLDRILQLDETLGVKDFDTASPLAGLGYGLPISRNYARYFGGDLQIMSMEGYGTDSFIYLPRLSVDGDDNTSNSFQIL